MQNLVEKILRMKIYNSTYWKERCFGLTAETLVDEAVGLKFVGGTYGGARKPTDFMCLVLKLLQIQPDREIVVEFIKNEDYKYVRVLGECTTPWPAAKADWNTASCWLLPQLGAHRAIEPHATQECTQSCYSFLLMTSLLPAYDRRHLIQLFCQPVCSLHLPIFITCYISEQTLHA